MAWLIFFFAVLLYQSCQSLAALCLTAKDHDHCYQLDEECHIYKRIIASCTNGTSFHCLRNVNTGKFIEGCFKPVDCPKGTEPLVEYIPEARVVCKTCKNELRFNPRESTPSNEYSECNRMRDACSPDQGKFKCDPKSAKDNHSNFFWCRCDVRRGYSRYGRFNMSQPVCSYDQDYECLKMCREDEDVSLEGYQCLNKTCPEGSSRTDEYSDDCIPFRSPDKTAATVATKTPQDRTVASISTSHVTIPPTARPVSTEMNTTTQNPQDNKDERGEEGYESPGSKQSVIIAVSVCSGVVVFALIIGVICWCNREKLKGWLDRKLRSFRRKQDGAQRGAERRSSESNDARSEAMPLMPTEEAIPYERLSDKQKKEMFKEAIRINHGVFVRDMNDPERILDSFWEKELLDEIVIRNIREKRETTEMNRQILTRINSWEKYCIFKEILKDIGSVELCGKFEKTEKDMYDVCPKDQSMGVTSDNPSINGSSGRASDTVENSNRVDMSISEVVVHSPHDQNTAQCSNSASNYENNGGSATAPGSDGGMSGESNSAISTERLDEVVHHSEMHPLS